VYVISAEDIRLSGATSLPEVLRLAPGIDSTRFSGNRWAVSARGFAELLAARLLVLVDGRNAFNPAFSGVARQDFQLLWEDIERIEIVRGPAATIWGTNGMNGVINIPKSAAATQGGQAVVGGGTVEGANARVRWGGQNADGSLFYRAYGAAQHANAQDAGSGDSYSGICKPTIPCGMRCRRPRARRPGLTAVSTGILLTFPAKSVVAEELKGVRVLVVDDNRTNLEKLRRQLQNWGMAVTCTDSGEQVLAMLAAEAEAGRSFELAILDMHMPLMDGLELARRIRSEHALAVPKLVMLTSTYAAGNAEERAQAGILRCVTKPLRQSELFGVVCSVIRESTGVAASSPVVASVTPTTLAPLTGGSVLLAEDNLVNLEVAKAMLLKLGVRLTSVSNGARAVALSGMQDFDVVLMDCQMPVMDGYEATALIRQREAGGPRRLPIIALTANAMGGDREKCLAAGMDDYLTERGERRCGNSLRLGTAPGSPGAGGQTGRGRGGARRDARRLGTRGARNQRTACRVMMIKNTTT
jgi:CheY-like chemotaxis protein